MSSLSPKMQMYASLGAGVLVLVLCIYGLSDGSKKGTSQSGASKWLASLAGAGIFLIVSSPLVYKYTDMAMKKFMGDSYALAEDDGETPTPLGISAHAAVFFLASRAIMAF